MAANPQRRLALLDATLDVLAASGARGLTFRAVDTHAGVPAGTSSNYFTDRDELLTQAGHHVLGRLAPDPKLVAEAAERPSTRALEAELMLDLLRRVEDDRAAYLAMLELRLEATRRPALAEALTTHYRANLDTIIGDHVEGAFPGDRSTAVLLYLAMTGLIVEHLTLPAVLEATDRTPEQLVADVVAAVVPDA